VYAEAFFDLRSASEGGSEGVMVQWYNGTMVQWCNGYGKFKKRISFQAGTGRLKMSNIFPVARGGKLKFNLNTFIYFKIS